MVTHGGRAGLRPSSWQEPKRDGAILKTIVSGRVGARQTSLGCVPTDFEEFPWQPTTTFVALRTVRRFQKRPVSDKDLAAVLEAARWTGSAKNLQLWSFIVIDDPEQKARLVETGSFMTPVVNAPMAIALVRMGGGYDFDTGRVAQNLMLAADAIGLGSCPVTLHDDAAARA